MSQIFNPSQVGGSPVRAARLSAFPEATEVADAARGTAAAASSESSSKSVEEAVADMKAALGKTPTALEFEVDEESGDRLIVRITDAQTGELIRQIPSEEVVQVARNLQRFGSGLISETA